MNNPVDAVAYTRTQFMEVDHIILLSATPHPRFPHGDIMFYTVLVDDEYVVTVMFADDEFTVVSSGHGIGVA